jgi:hypothetical protein
MPVVSQITPEQVPVGAPATTISLAGSNFVSGAKVSWNGTSLATTFVSSNALTALVPNSLLTTAGDNDITVSNPAPGGGTCPAVNFSVVNIAPTLASIGPAQVVEGAANTTITLVGTGFLIKSVVTCGDTPLTTTFVSATQLKAAIPASLLLNPDTFDVFVSNPAPGGGDTDPLPFRVNAGATSVTVVSSPAPTITRSGNNLFVTVTLANIGRYAARNLQVTAGKLNTTAFTAVLPADGLLVPKAGTGTVTLTFPSTAAVKGTTPTVTVTFTSDNAGTATFTVTTGKVP